MNFVSFTYRNVTHTFNFLFRADQSSIFYPDLFYFRVFREHSHSYCLRAFFYESKHFYVYDKLRSKSKLAHVVQNMLKQELNIDVQFS